MDPIEAIVRRQLSPDAFSNLVSTDDTNRDGEAILRIWVRYDGQIGKPTARQMIDVTDDLALSPLLNGRIPVVSFVDVTDDEAPIAAE